MTPAEWEQVILKMEPRAKEWIVLGLADAMPVMVDQFEINTALRQQHFLAQLAHESDHFQTTREYASGKAYEMRSDLGNTVKGDGERYRGRGLIQLTGRANYASASTALGENYVGQPIWSSGSLPPRSCQAGFGRGTTSINMLTATMHGRSARSSTAATTGSTAGWRCSRSLRGQLLRLVL